MQKELLKKCNKHFSSNDIHVAEQSEPVVLSPEPVGGRIVVVDVWDEDERGWCDSVGINLYGLLNVITKKSAYTLVGDMQTSAL